MSSVDEEVLRVADVYKDPERFSGRFKDALVVTHSAGIMAVDSAARVMALNPPEPTQLPRTILGGIKVGLAYEHLIKYQAEQLKLLDIR